MSSPGLPNLELDVRSRRMEKRVALVAICFAAVAPWLMQQGWKALFLSIVASGLCGWGFRRAGWFEGGRRISRVSWWAEGHWLLMDTGGREYVAALRADSRVTTGLVWLRWQVRKGEGKQGGARSMLLTLGDIPQSQLRQLCVRLRLSGYNSSESPPIGQPRTPAI